MNRIETAVSRFNDGFLCSQALLSTYGKRFGMEEETAERLATGFGAGMGRLADTCGAVTGAVMVLGLKCGGRGGDQEAKEKTFQRVREFVTRFQARNGSVICRNLLDCDISSPEGLELAKQKELFVTVCPKMVRDAAEIETPAHRVTISKPFQLGATEVTVGQFCRFVKETGYNATGQMVLTWSDKHARFVRETGYDASGQLLNSDPSKKCGLAGYGFEIGKWVRKAGYDWQNVGYEMSDDHPVLNVSWYDAVEFCKWLSKKEGQEYRLPTEAEWAHACRAGTETRRFFGNDRGPLPNYAWGEGNSGNRPQPVGRKKPNPFGLYDIYGNVWEWCRDWYAPYESATARDPQGPASGTDRVLRGGSWFRWAQHLRSAYRGKANPLSRYDAFGFRVVL